MKPRMLLRLDPSGPFRFGTSTGARDRTETLLHSDTLYAAVTAAIAQLGQLEEWLTATSTAHPVPAVAFSSVYPFAGQHLFVVPPRSVWPPAEHSPKVRWHAARLVPVAAIEALFRGDTLPDDRWVVDAASGCLLPVERNIPLPPPFRIAQRTAAAVDRVEPGRVELHTTACLEFRDGAGLWCLAVFADAAAEQRWRDPIRAAFRLLGDSGIGGERSRGWGRFSVREDQPPALLAPSEGTDPGARGWWLLSLFTPADHDIIDWTRGHYELLERGGRIESPALSGGLKLSTRMVDEGSILLAQSEPVGRARDVAPEGFPHPVYRAGFAVAVALPSRTEPAS